ncbi:hypothetical protein EC988_003755, partial [Linderina pennispora]
MYSFNITVLDLSGNQLTILPDEIGHLKQLRELNVGSNRLTSVPATITHCQELRTFNASGNQLDTLPSSMRHMHSLRTVDASRNALSTVPMCLWQLPNIDSMDLSGNPITALPARMFLPDGTMAPNTSRQVALTLDGCPLGQGLLDHIERPSQVLKSRYKYGVISEEGISETEHCT